MVRAKLTVLMCLLALGVGATPLGASPIRAGFDNATLGPTDDGSSGAVDIGFTLDFFSTSHSQLYVNNNGNVTFGQSLSAYAPAALDSMNIDVIAPFFADVDTANGIGDSVTYGQGQTRGRAAFAVNWLNVNYYNNFDDNGQLNSFQLVLIDRGDTGAGNFDLEFNYGQILWETGMASGGDANGLGGNSARAGFASATGRDADAVELDGSAINGAFLDGGAFSLSETSNIGMAGRHVFAFRQGGLQAQQPEPVPVPSALLLMMSALVLLDRRRILA